MWWNRVPANKKKQLPHVQIKGLNGTNDTPNTRAVLLLLSKSQAINSSNSVLKGRLAEKLKWNFKVWQWWRVLEDFLWQSKTKVAKRAIPVILKSFVLSNTVVIKSFFCKIWKNNFKIIFQQHSSPHIPLQLFPAFSVGLAPGELPTNLSSLVPINLVSMPYGWSGCGKQSSPYRKLHQPLWGWHGWPTFFGKHLQAQHKSCEHIPEPPCFLFTPEAIPWQSPLSASPDLSLSNLLWVCCFSAWWCGGSCQEWPKKPGVGLSAFGCPRK